MSAGQDYCFVVEGKMSLPYQYFAGTIGSKFIVALRDGQKVLGVRSAKTGKTYVPPRQVCEKTFERLDENWVEVKDTGTVTGFTVIRYAEPYQPKQPPYVLALIQLDGADTAFAHLLECGDVSEAKVGLRVQAVFSETPQNNILDIAHFVPIA